MWLFNVNKGESTRNRIIFLIIKHLPTTILLCLQIYPFIARKWFKSQINYLLITFPVIFQFIFKAYRNSIPHLCVASSFYLCLLSVIKTNFFQYKQAPVQNIFMNIGPFSASHRWFAPSIFTQLFRSNVELVKTIYWYSYTVIAMPSYAIWPYSKRWQRKQHKVSSSYAVHLDSSTMNSTRCGKLWSFFQPHLI